MTTLPPSAYAIGLAHGWITPAWVALCEARRLRERARDREYRARRRLGLPSLTACHHRSNGRARASQVSEPVRRGRCLLAECDDVC